MKGRWQREIEQNLSLASHCIVGEWRCCRSLLDGCALSAHPFPYLFRDVLAKYTHTRLPPKCSIWHNNKHQSRARAPWSIWTDDYIPPRLDFAATSHLNRSQWVAIDWVRMLFDLGGSAKGTLLGAKAPEIGQKLLGSFVCAPRLPRQQRVVKGCALNMVKQKFSFLMWNYCGSCLRDCGVWIFWMPKQFNSVRWIKHIYFNILCSHTNCVCCIQKQI